MRDEWQAASEIPPLGPGEVHLWRADLSEAADEPDIYLRNLTPAEAERAERFRAGQVRMQYMVARACLRVVLGNHMGMRPNDVPITLNAHGKPEIASASDALFFNVAHSRETILIALGREGRVGVDIEYLDRETDALEIARNSFTPNEFRLIEQAGDPADQRRAFFRCWTRKEAVMKADGRGLSIPLSAIEVPVADQAVSTPVRIAESGLGGSELWFVTDLALGDGIAGALAVSLPKLRLRAYGLPLGRLR